MSNNRSIPNNTVAEKAILAAMMMRNGEAIPKVLSLLSTEDFYLEEHRILFISIIEMNNKRIRIDSITITEYLKKNGQLDKVGGPLFILSFGDVVPTTANIIYHAKIVKEKSTLRRLIEAGEAIATEAYEDNEDIDLILDSAEQKIFSITSKETSGEFEHIKPIIDRVFEKVNKLYEEGGGKTGTETGFRDFDKLTSGLQNSDLILLAARPSMGKTAFALNIAANVSMGKGSIKAKNVAVFSMEMSKEQLGHRMLSSRSGIDAQRLKTGGVSGEEWLNLNRTVSEISKAKLYIDDTPGLTVMELRARSRRLKSMYGLDLMIIDYLQLMQGRQSKNGDGNRQQEISEISRSLKALARELNVPIIALSQLSRAVEMRADKKPQLSDLRESGSLEQDADIVMFLYREEYYNSNTENQNLTELIIAKNRNGPTQTLKLQFNKNLIRFGDYIDKNNLPE